MAGRYKTNDIQDDLLARLKSMEDRLSTLERTPQLGDSGIAKGTLTVEGEGGIRVIGANGSEIVLDDGLITTISGDTSGDEVPGQIIAAVLTPGSGPGIAGRMALYLIGPHSSAGNPDNNLMYIEGETPGSPGSFLIRGNATGGSGVVSAAIMDVHGDDTLVLRALTNGAFLTAPTAILVSSESSTLQLDGNQIAITSDADQCFIDHTTTASAANARIETTGQILRSTSASRYKTSIQDLDIDTSAVLQLRPRTWQDKKEAEGDPNSRRYVGLVAEEVAEHLPAFVEFNEDGSAEYVAYERLTVALLAVVQEQAEQIAALSPKDKPLPKRRRTGVTVGAQVSPVVAKPDRVRVPEVPKLPRTDRQVRINRVPRGTRRQ
jgi:hypothetical protein